MSKTLLTNVKKYLKKRAVSNPWQITDAPVMPLHGAVVIPALAESSSLTLTLQSLAKNRAELLSKFMILIVVNNRIDATEEEKLDNINTLEQLPNLKKRYELNNLCWINAASTGLELPLKQGVGLARKIGLDLALTQLDFTLADPLLISLDADTLVETDYLEAICQHFSNTKTGAASIAYRHLLAADKIAQAAIDRYELFLRAYILGLELAGSTYAFHTVGSAMVCRTSAYIAAGGMNSRVAGEDFYFLQQLHKVSGVSALNGTVVHPSPRSSDRVPFGTGRSVGDILSVGENKLLFYQPKLFEILKNWLDCSNNGYGKNGDQMLKLAGEISTTLEDYLQESGFIDAWDNISRNSSKKWKFEKAWQEWFDAFRTMRMIHYISDNQFQRISPEQALPPLLEQIGISSSGVIEEMLEQLRSYQSPTP